MSKLFAIGKARIRMMEKLGFDEKQYFVRIKYFKHSL